MIGKLHALIAAVWNRWTSRREFLSLDDRHLRDIGASRYDALVEARKPFWRD